jgi:hypothetical protein
MKNLTRQEALGCKLTFLLLFFPVLLFCTGAYPAKQKVVKEDGIKYCAAQSVSDEAFKRTKFVVQQMTSHSPEIREKMVATGFTVELIEKIKFSAIYRIMPTSRIRRCAMDGISIPEQGAWAGVKCARLARKTSCA